MKMVRHTFVITGVSPLLMANPQDMSDEGDKPRPVDTDRETRKRFEAERSAYRAEDGQLYGPAAGLRNAILKAAVGRKFKLEKKAVSAPAMVAGAVFNVHDRCLLVDPETDEPITEYVIDSRRVVNAKTKGAFIAHRASVPSWRTELTFEINEHMLQATHVLELLNIAGCYPGWMAFRPEKKGHFGRFTAKIKEEKPDKASERNARARKVPV